MIKFLVSLIFISISAHALEGQFIVSTDNDDLDYYSHFPLDTINITPEHLSFKMPPELASDKALEVKFERNNVGNNTLNSYFGSAHCLQQEPKLIKCKVEFNSLFQKVLVENLFNTMDYISNSTNNIEDLTNLLILAETFVQNPKGVLLIRIARER